MIMRDLFMLRGAGKRVALLVVVLFLVASVLSACGSKKEDNAGSDSSSADFPITIKHAFGETVVEEKPERIVAIGWSNQDTPLSLGVLPVGISQANYGTEGDAKLLAWTQEKIDELGGKGDVAVFNDVDGLDFEAISECEPDIILAAYSGITQEDYDTLSEIAPVVAYPKNPWETLWRDQVLINSKAMGMETEGEELISDLDKMIEKSVSKYPELSGKTAAFVYFDPTNLSTLSVYTSGDPRAAFLTDLGLGVAPSVEKLAKDAETFYLTISAENADQLSDVDVILTWANGDGTDLLKQLQDDPLIGGIPAIKNGAIVMFSEGPLAAAQTPSTLSIPATIDEYVKTIAKAAKKAK
jgi:iron complex transport system substrate-binding protein